MFTGLKAPGIKIEATSVAPQGTSGTPRAPMNAIQLVPSAPAAKPTLAVKKVATGIEVTYQGTLLSLTPREYMILDCLLRQPTQVFTRSMLMDKLWDYDQMVGEETIKTHLVNLRRKLKAAGSVQELIETVYGVGYRLRPI